MKTIQEIKEEISLEKGEGKWRNSIYHMRFSDEITQRYADQEMTAFAEWVCKNYERCWVGPEGGLYHEVGLDCNIAWKNRKYFTINQLLELYKEQRNENKI